PVGRCEAFFTDGLATLLYSRRKFKQLDERTVRWPGHAEKIRFMIRAGFFEKRRIKVDGGEVSPLDFSSALLTRLLKQGDDRDVTVMRVETSGIKAGRHVTVRHELLDKYDEKTATTSMGRTTGFTCSIICRMVGRGEIEGQGLLPPEEVLDNAKVEKLLRELSGKGVEVRQSVRSKGDSERLPPASSH
ncbi:MAG: saccharopine dehydrogenase, partial [Thaumarchaeota archaeon]|nr:saccharopine dehydrogenase [Nitrososphaerota archaeon]